MKREIIAWILVCTLAFLWGMNRVDLYFWKVEALESQRNAREIIRTNEKMWTLCYDVAEHYWSHLTTEAIAAQPQ